MIKIESISFSYKNQRIFKNASCGLPSKGVFILKGDNGIGKSTLLKLLMGLLILDEGSISIDDLILTPNSKEQDLVNIRNKIAYISQSSDFVSFLNAKENGSLGNIINDNKINNLELLDNDIYQNRKKNELSNGERILISIQRALNEGKHIFLLDECSDFLDQKNATSIINRLKQISNDNLVIIVSHDERLLKAFDKRILICDEKLICNFEMKEDELNVTNKNETKKKKYFFYIIRKLVKKNCFSTLLLTILLSIFSVIYSIAFAFLTYDFNKSYESTIGTGWYWIKSDNKGNLFNNIDMNLRFEYAKSSVSKDELDLIDSSLEINTYSGNLGLVINDDESIGKIVISESSYEDYLYRNLIEGNRIIVNYGVNMAKVSIPYKVEKMNSDGTYDDGNLNLSDQYIHINDLSIIKFDYGITLYGSIWENDNISFDSQKGREKLFSPISDVTFVTRSILEKENNTILNYDALDNEIYISNYNVDSYVEGNVRFFPYSNYDLGKYYSCFYDINNVFVETHLVQNEKIGALLKKNQVLISENNYDKIVSLLSLYGNPLIRVNDLNRKDLISFYNKNRDLKISSYSSVISPYSEIDFRTFKNDFSNKVGYYSFYICLLFIVELGVMYIYLYSYKYVNKVNANTLDRYTSKFKVTLVFSIPYIISLVLSSIVGILISTAFINHIFMSLNYNILKVSINLLSVILTLLVNMLIFIISFLYNYKTRTL